MNSLKNKAPSLLPLLLLTIGIALILNTYHFKTNSLKTNHNTMSPSALPSAESAIKNSVPTPKKPTQKIIVQQVVQKTPAKQRIEKRKLSQKEKFLSLFFQLREECEGGDEQACVAMEEGPESPQLPLYLCRLQKQNCREAGFIHLAAENKEEAAKSFESSCMKDHNGDSCLQYIQILEDAGVAQQDDQLEYYTLACDSHQATGCLRLAEVYLRLGHGKLYDRYYEKACQNDQQSQSLNCLHQRNL